MGLREVRVVREAKGAGGGDESGRTDAYISGTRTGWGWLRKVGHCGFGLLPFAIPRIGVAPVVAVVTAALLFNALLLPRWGGRRLWTESELQRGRSVALVGYPLSILILFALFWWTPSVVAAAWVTTAFGDAAAAVGGRWIGGPALPWNRGKSVAGSVAFLLIATPAAVAALLWVEPSRLQPPAAVLCGLVVAAVGALAESLDLGVDDNVVVPHAAAVTALAALTVLGR